MERYTPNSKDKELPNRPSIQWIKSSPDNGLEREMQGKLNQARTADRTLHDSRPERHLPVSNRPRARHGRNISMPRARETAWGSLRVGTETRIQTEVAVGYVKARVIEEVEELRVKTQFIPLGQLEILEKSEVETCLESSTERISRSVRKSSFGEIARSRR